MTHEHRPDGEATGGPEHDDRLPDAREVPVHPGPVESDLPPLLADLDEQDATATDRSYWGN